MDTGTEVTRANASPPSNAPAVRFVPWHTPAFLLSHELDVNAITVEVPGPLRAAAGGEARVAVEARTLRGVLEELERCYPALHRSVCDETGRVRPHVNLFVNLQHMRDREGLDTALQPGDVVIILPAVSGG